MLITKITHGIQIRHHSRRGRAQSIQESNRSGRFVVCQISSGYSNHDVGGKIIIGMSIL